MTILAASLAMSAAPAAATPPRSQDLPPPARIEPLPDGVPTLSLSFAKIVVGIKDGSRYLMDDAGPLCLTSAVIPWKGGQYEVRRKDYAVAFKVQLSAAHFKVEGADDSLFENSADTAADLAVAGEITGIDGEFCYQLAPFVDYADSKGAMTVTMRWEIYSRLDRKVVARVETFGYGGSKKLRGDAENKALDEAYLENVKALANDATFRKLVLSVPADSGQPVSPSGLTRLAIHAVGSKLALADTIGSVVAVFAGDGFGSGFVLGDGYLLTNRHVVGDSKTVKVKWSDGLETVGEVVRSDARRDVALIRTDTRGRPCLTIRTDPVSLGDTVFAIGTPLDPKFQSTVTRGVVSATRVFDGFSYIQSDVTVNPGNSGGPLLDEGGRVVGMTVSGMRPGSAPSGINLFIPIRDAVDFLALAVGPVG